MYKKLLKFNLVIVFLPFFGYCQISDNYVRINSGLSYRISDKQIWGTKTLQGIHKDMPSYTLGFNYQRKIIGDSKKIYSLHTIFGIQNQGIKGKKVHYKSIIDPDWKTQTEEYYRKYEYRYLFLTSGLSQLFKLNDKIFLKVNTELFYLFRQISIIKTKFPNNDTYFSYTKGKSRGIAIPGDHYNRFLGIASIGMDYKLSLNESSIMNKILLSSEIGSSLNSFGNKNKHYPIFCNVGFGYSF